MFVLYCVVRSSTLEEIKNIYIPSAVRRIPTPVGFELSKPGLRCASEAHN